MLAMLGWGVLVATSALLHLLGYTADAVEGLRELGITLILVGLTLRSFRNQKE